jgi:hypothetical protein
MRFLRFSYVIDFLSLQALKNIYDYSVEEFKDFLKLKLNSKDIFILK